MSYRVSRMASVRDKNNLVSSIKYALTYMGLNELERWLNIMMLQDLGKDKPEELLITSVIRSRFAEVLAKRAGMSSNYQNAASLMGLFSTLDGILDQSMEHALMGISLPVSIQEALVHQEGVLYPIYKLMFAYEKGDWHTTERLAETMFIDAFILDQDCREAIKWANEID